MLLHLNSGGNALAVEPALSVAGYSVEDAGAAPGGYGVLLRVGPSPAEVAQHRKDHRTLVEVAPNVWTGPVQHDRGCLAPAAGLTYFDLIHHRGVSMQVRRLPQ